MEEREPKPPAIHLAEGMVNQMLTLQNELAETRAIVRQLLRVFSILAAKTPKSSLQEVAATIGDIVRGLGLRKR